MTTQHSLFSELKRRNVLRAAALYIGAAWALSQGVAQLLPVFGFDNWVVRWFVIAAAIGFPFAMLFSWFYEWTPQGIQRESEVSPEESVTHETGKKLDRWIIAVLSLAVVLLLANIFVLHTDTKANAPAAVAAQAAGKSIAVLPFENLSADKDNAYFATGMQDMILTKLAEIGDLKVISRTSTEKYASHPDNLKGIAQQLGVATILEGSVQKSGSQVLINVQLIDASTDNHLWAQAYPRTLDNIFGVEGEVAQKVAEALKAKLQPAESARIANVPTRNPEAYDRFFKAENFTREFDANTAKDPAEAVHKAADLYASAIAADPGFALAYARLSYVKSRAYWIAVDPSQKAIDDALDAAKKALALQPNLPEAHLAMGYIHYWGHRDYAAALTEFATVRASLPNDTNVLAAMAFVHRRQGNLSQAIDELKQATVLDPRDTKMPRDLADTLGYVRRYAEAEAANDRALALAPNNSESLLNRASAMQMDGDLEGANRTLAAIPADFDPLGSVSLARFNLALAMRQPDAALAALAKAPATLQDIENNVLVPAVLLRGRALALKGEAAPARAAFLEAQQALETLVRVPRERTNAEKNLAIVYAGLGQKDAALAAARRATELLPLAQDMLDGSYYLSQLAKIEAQVGETDSALKHIEQLLDAPAGYEVSAASLRTDPAWDPLRKDPRFGKLISDAEAAKAKSNQ